MRASVPCESSNRPGRQQQLPDCLADNNIARKYHTQALHPKTRINACNRPLHKIPTPQSPSQNISKIADQFQYPPCTRDEVTTGRMERRRGGVGVDTKNLWLMMIVTSEWNSWSARKWRAHAQLNHHWSWWEEVKQRRASQSPLRIHSVQLGVRERARQWRSSSPWSPRTILNEAQPGNVGRCSTCSGEWGTARLSSESMLSAAVDGFRTHLVTAMTQNWLPQRPEAHSTWRRGRKLIWGTARRSCF